MAQGKCKVLVEKVTQKLAHSIVGPAAMDQQQSLEVAELGYGIVAGQDSLQALLARDANANVGSCQEGEQELLMV